MERLIEMFEEMVDIRESSGKRHCLTHIIVMSVCGIGHLRCKFYLPRASSGVFFLKLTSFNFLFICR